MRARHFAGSLVAVFVVAASFAQAPLGTAFTYQGELKIGSSPADGVHDLRFRLYDALAGGSIVAGPVCQDNVAVVAGLFTVSVDFGATAFNGDARWLEIGVRADATPGNCAVGVYTTLAQRQPLTATPYALQSRGIYVSPSNDFVGIGRQTTIGTGEILGLYRDTFGNSFGGMFVQTNAAGQPYYGYAAGGDTDAYHYFDGSQGNWRLFVGFGDRLTVNGSTGNVGLGTTAPLARLHVSTNTAASDNNTAVFAAPTIGPNLSHIHYGTTGDWYIRSASNSGKVVLQDGGGNVGIGTANPTRPLHVETAGVTAVYGLATENLGGIAVQGDATGNLASTIGVLGRSGSPTGKGVYGLAMAFSGGSYGVYGESSSPSSAAYGVYADGNLGAGGTKSFRIDHPDDPENKYLLHYAAESPEVINFYSGKATLDAAGRAVIELPDYFARVNRDPRYTLTAMGVPMPNLHVAGEIDEAALSVGATAEPDEAVPVCSFRVAGGAPGAKVSWEVKAVRNDRWVQRRGAPVEIDKPPHERGKYQRPELYDQPAHKRSGYHSGPVRSQTPAT